MKTSERAPSGPVGPSKAPSSAGWFARVRGVANRTFDSLNESDFRILWLGFMGSWFAMQMQQVARGYLAYELTGNALALGLVTLAMGLPRIVFSRIASPSVRSCCGPRPPSA
jgi:hypothetical protein